MTRFQASHDVRVGAIIVNEADELLVVRHARRGERYWTLPGGSVEMGESLSEAIAREVLEETGYSVDVGPVAAVAELRPDRWGAARIEVFFLARVAGQTPRNTLRNEGIVDVAWRDRDSLDGDFRPHALLPVLNDLPSGATFLGNVLDPNDAGVTK
jgi:ADP-ribose pyrophosphatase YjhB (NUDIX family)